MRLRLGLAILLCLSSLAYANEEPRELSVAGHVVLGTLRTPSAMQAETPLVVMTHGTLAHKDMEIIQALAKGLAERGIASLAHTLSLGLDRRKGMYDCATGHDYLTDDAVAEIDAWVRQANAISRRIYVLGHSRGANQVARYLASDPNAPVQGAVLVAPATGSLEAGVRASYAATYGAELEPLIDRAVKDVVAGRGGEWMSVPGFIYCRDSKVTARAFASFYSADPRQDTAALVAGLKIPVLVFAAAKDTTVPDVESAFAKVTREQGDRVRLEMIADADHFFRDLASEDVADRIADFVSNKR